MDKKDNLINKALAVGNPGNPGRSKPRIKKRGLGILNIVAAVVVASTLALTGCGNTGGGSIVYTQREKDIMAELDNPIYQTFKSIEFKSLIEKSKVGGEYEVYADDADEVENYINKINKSVISNVIKDYNNYFNLTLKQDDESKIIDISWFYNGQNPSMHVITQISSGIITTTYQLTNEQIEDLKKLFTLSETSTKLKLPGFVNEIVDTYSLVNPYGYWQIDYENSKTVLDEVADKLLTETGYQIDPNYFYIVGTRLENNSVTLGYSKDNSTTQFPILIKMQCDKNKISFIELLQNDFNNDVPKRRFLDGMQNYKPFNEYFEAQTYLTAAKTTVIEHPDYYLFVEDRRPEI